MRDFTPNAIKVKRPPGAASYKSLIEQDFSAISPAPLVSQLLAQLSKVLNSGRIRVSSPMSHKNQKSQTPRRE
ncbi:hypothetical protein POHY109586_17795 [Polaromonas hydrogenivorans]